MSLSPASYKRSKNTDDSGFLVESSPARKIGKNISGSYREIYNYIAENSESSLDSLYTYCTTNLRCTRETFSQAIQAYIISR
jgi:hypothetical protein